MNRSKLKSQRLKLRLASSVKVYFDLIETEHFSSATGRM